MRLIFLAVIALVGSPLFAGDCPTPKPLSCERLLTLAEQRHCLATPQTAAATPVVVAPCAAPAPCPVPTINVACPECNPTEKIVTAYLPAPAPKPHGEGMVGFGPLYQAGWGLQSVIGYKWANGWQLVGGPNYVKHDDYNGTTACNSINQHDTKSGGDHDSNGGGNYCTPMPYTVPGRSPWGGTVLLMHSF